MKQMLFSIKCDEFYSRPKGFTFTLELCDKDGKTFGFFDLDSNKPNGVFKFKLSGFNDGDQLVNFTNWETVNISKLKYERDYVLKANDVFFVVCFNEKLDSLDFMFEDVNNLN